jgi:hypothetical protein
LVPLTRTSVLPFLVTLNNFCMYMENRGFIHVYDELVR